MILPIRFSGLEIQFCFGWVWDWASCFLFWSSFICCSRRNRIFITVFRWKKEWSFGLDIRMGWSISFFRFCSSGICSFCRKLYREKYSCVWICFFNLLSYRDFMCFGMRQFYMCSLTLCFDHCVFFFIYWKCHQSVCKTLFCYLLQNWIAWKTK